MVVIQKCEVEAREGWSDGDGVEKIWTKEEMADDTDDMGIASPGALLEENLDEDDAYSISRDSQGLGQESETASLSEGEVGGVLRYEDPEALKNHIETVMKIGREKTTFKGVEELKNAAEEGDEQFPPRVRQGQIIFGSVSVAHVQGYDNSCKGDLYNMIAPIIMAMKTGQPRKYPYLHAAVYAGMHKGYHYVIENGGHLTGSRLGMISATPMDRAFEENAEFFVLSPPKDSEGRSTRYLVLQRALASLGMYYNYHMRAVSCEVFAMTLLKLRPTFEPLQTEVLSPSKGYEITDKKKQEDEKKFMEFHNALCGRIGIVTNRLILSLQYYLDHVKPNPRPDSNSKMQEMNENYPTWATNMALEYEHFFEAIHM